MSPRMGRVFWVSALLVSINFAWAYTPTFAPGGSLVRWTGPLKLNLAGNATNQNGIGPVEFFAAAVRGLQRWKNASGGSLSFDYWQGTDPGIYPVKSEFDGLSSMYFASNSTIRLSPNVLGLTQVFYNTETGEILETDIVLNDRDFQFTTNARDTSGYGTGNTNGLGSRSKVFVENVITHELGHAFGLAHAGGLQATMLFMESPEQAHLSCDDQVAVRALYPAADASARGSLGGLVVSESGQPIYGAHVLAISARRGTVLATGISDRAGRYAIGALEPGPYYLMIEPFLAGYQVLPSYYSGMNPDVCTAGEAFSRSFLTDSSGFELQSVNVPAGPEVAAPTITARCPRSGGAAISSSSSVGMVDSAELAVHRAGQSGRFGIVDRYRYSGPVFYRIPRIQGHVEIHVLSYSLYSPLGASLRLLRSDGSTVETVTSDRVYTGDSGFSNFDTALVADDLKYGDYFLQVDGAAISSSYYPAGPMMVDSVPFMMITGSFNEGEPPLAAALPFNARCRMDENFPIYVSPPGNPPRSSRQKEESTGFCGTVRDAAGGGSRPGPGAGAVIGWLLPWLVMAGAARLFRADLSLRTRV